MERFFFHQPLPNQGLGGGDDDDDESKSADQLQDRKK
jgi:hypothetical protein